MHKREIRNYFLVLLEVWNRRKPCPYKNKDKNGKVISEEEQIMERWTEYFKELLEEKDVRFDNNEQENINEVIKLEKKITKQEIKESIRKAEQREGNRTW